MMIILLYAKYLALSNANGILMNLVMNLLQESKRMKVTTVKV